MYTPVNSKKRDSAVYKADRLLKETEWLKGIWAYNEFFTIINVCLIEQINTERMSNPSLDKAWRYEQYYQASGKLPQAIVVDEDNYLRDGEFGFEAGLEFYVGKELLD